MRLLLAVVVCALVACGGGAMQNVQLVNKTARTIDSVFIFTPGGDRGASKAKLAPGASTTVQLPAGNHEIYAVSEKIFHEDNTRETPEASLTIELRSALEVVFFDSNAPPPGLERGDTRGIAFKIREKKKAEDGEEGGEVTPMEPTP